MSHSPVTDSQPITVAVSGAAGTIGYSLLFRMAAGGMFGSDHSLALRLLEHPWRLPQLRGVGMEIDDCNFPLVHSLTVTDDPHEAFHAADWIILLAGSPRDVPRPTRLELLRCNGSIYVEHGRAINAASPTAKILVVAAPCNTNCLIAMRHAQDVPREHWFALSRVNQMRAAAMIARKAGVAVRHVHRVIAWGNHGDRVYVDLHNARIGNQPANDIVTDASWKRGELQDTVRHRAAEVFQLRGLAPAATAAHAILGTIHSLTTPTPLDRFFSAAVPSDGSYEIPRDVVFSFPLRTEDGKHYSVVNGLYLDEFAQNELRQNVEQLEEEAVLAEKWFG